MPTMAIACPISRLPHQGASRLCDDIITRAASDPSHRIRAQPSESADDCQRKKESEDYMGRHQQSVDSGNTETESDLIASTCRCCRWIGHHVERVEDKSDTSDRH